MPRLRTALLPLLALALFTLPAAARQQAPPQLEQSLITLEALRESIARKQAELAEKHAALEAAPSQMKEERLEELRLVERQLERLRDDFESVATGLDFSELEEAPRKGLDLKAELERLLAPIIEQLKDATESPRQIEELRSALAYYREREALARAAIAHVERLRAAADTAPLAAALDESLAEWRQRLLEIENQETVARFQLESRLGNQPSLIDSVRGVLSEFFATRGLNLALAIVAFLVAFFGLRWLYRVARRMSPLHRGAEQPFYARLIDVLAHTFTGVAALTASLLVFYAAGDWVLLGLLLLFLLGIAWASKNTLPQFLDQIRLLLNFGAVRERERVVYGGLPWRVSSLSLYTILSNPELAGGIVRLPLKDLLDMRSRPVAKDDVWFPSHRGDWVRLSDGRFGQVLHQSAEAVRLKLLGGSSVTYQTLEYLGLAPENLSGGFRVRVTFGIDYQHQAISTTQVPQLMHRRLERELTQLAGAEALVKLSVEFEQAGASSLDYRVHADFTGEVAGRAMVLQRAVSRVLVELCNDEGWVIPFTQVTLHQA